MIQLGGHRDSGEEARSRLTPRVKCPGVVLGEFAGNICGGLARRSADPSQEGSGIGLVGPRSSRAGLVRLMVCTKAWTFRRLANRFAGERPGSVLPDYTWTTAHCSACLPPGKSRKSGTADQTLRLARSDPGHIGRIPQSRASLRSAHHLSCRQHGWR